MHLVVNINTVAFLKVIGEASWKGDLAKRHIPEFIREFSISVCSVWVWDSGSGTGSLDEVQKLFCIVLVSDIVDLDVITLIWDIADGHIVRP